MEIAKILNDIIKELDCTMTSFASLISFNKSFVCKVFKSEKKLSQNMLNAILKCDEISADAKERLQCAFLSQKYNEFDEKLVTHFFDSINSVGSSIKNLTVPETRDNTFESKIFSDNIPYHAGSKAELLEIAAFFAKKVIKKRSSFLYTNYLVCQKELDSCIFSVLYERDYGNELDFCHLLDFPKYFSEENIDVLTCAFKWSTVGLNTHIKIGFEQKNETFISPYYIITDDAVISFNKEMDNGIVFTDTPTISFYKNEFLKMKSEFKELINFVSDEINLSTDRNAQTDTLLFTLDNLCPIGFCLDKTLIKELTGDRIENKEYFADYIYSCFSESVKSVSYNIFTTVKALERFCQTGKVLLFSGKYTEPLPPKSREKVFRNLLKAVENRNVNISILDSEKFYSDRLIMQEFYSNITVLNCVFAGGHLNDNGIYKAKVSIRNSDIIGFDGFADSLKEYLDSGVMTFPQSSVKMIIKNLIIKCRHIED
ncbi:MAG: hypothetical protein ACI4SB_06975 [Acutalibacteraceae bacterium]